MANSGIVWIDIIFNWSVSALYVVADAHVCYFRLDDGLSVVSLG
jgi:hypothetical protein